MSYLTAGTLSGASVALLNLLLAELGPTLRGFVPGNSGLPPDAIDCPQHHLVLAATPVTEPMFDEAMEHYAATRKRDVIVIRHGFHPETLDPVRLDVAARSIAGSILIRNTSLFRHLDGSLHLVPAAPDLFGEIGICGLDLSLAAPWNTREERPDGLERAAAEVVRACRRRSA